MNRVVGAGARVRQQARPIGPGRLVLVVGPSGAGKDTLIEGARAACAGAAGVVFARRAITRPPSASEDNAAWSEAEFDQAVAEGAFALAWSAHGHKYGIPSVIDDDIRAGRTVVCNVSRTVVAQARRRYAQLTVVLVTASPEVLAARLSARERATDGDIASRLRRAVEVELDCEADVIIRNAGTPEAGTRRLLNVIQDGVFDIVS